MMQHDDRLLLPFPAGNALIAREDVAAGQAVEQKSMGAYAKSGSSRISGLIKPGSIPRRSGLDLVDVVPDGEVRFGFPNISDNAEIVELIAWSCHAAFFINGRGSV